MSDTQGEELSSIRLLLQDKEKEIDLLKQKVAALETIVESLKELHRVEIKIRPLISGAPDSVTSGNI